MVRKRILKTVQEYLVEISKKYVVEKAFLFGSVVSGNSDKNSDIDIAIILLTVPDFFEIQLDLMKLRRKFDLRIEPHLFSIKDFNESNPFVAEILKTGMEINVKQLERQIN